MKIIDMHCDTVSGALIRYGKNADLLHMPEMMLDLERMKKGDLLAQFFAIFVSPREGYADYETYIASCRHVFDENMKLHADLIAPARNAEDIRRNQSEGKMSGILTMEDGVAVDGKLENLKRFYDMGVRALNLTWNYANCFGAPNSMDVSVMQTGLTSFGKEAVACMQDMGMIVDVSHLSDGGFMDVADICRKPFIASHSNCRALSPHPRNLTDEMIRILADHGGVAGINFYPLFLNADQTDMHSRIQRMVDMAEHMKQIGGIDVIGMGSDFDGITGELELAGCDQFGLLETALYRAGFTPSELDKMMGGNALRVLQDTL